MTESPRTTTRSADEDLRVAFHEAGHAVMTYELGGNVGHVTVDRHSTFAGMALSTLRHGDRPLPGLPAAVPRLTLSEREILVSVAGRVGESLRCRSTTTPRRTQSHRDIEAARTIAALTRDLVPAAPASARGSVSKADAVAFFAAAEAADADRTSEELALTSDDAAAFEYAMQLNDRDPATARLHIDWLTRVAAMILEPHLAKVEALAAHLLLDRTLSASDVSWILTSTRSFEHMGQVASS